MAYSYLGRIFGERGCWEEDWQSHGSLRSSEETQEKQEMSMLLLRKGAKSRGRI